MKIWPILWLVVGHFLGDVLSQQVSSSQGGRSESTCIAGICPCNTGSTHRQDEFCIPSGSRVLSISGDQGELSDWRHPHKANLLLPGRVRLLEVIVPRKHRSSESCHFQIFAEISPRAGRLFVFGVQVNFQLLGNAAVKHGIGTRITGTVVRGLNHFIPLGRNRFYYEQPMIYDDDDDVIGSGSGDDANPELDDTKVDETIDEDILDKWGIEVPLDLGDHTVRWDTRELSFARLSVSDCFLDVLFQPPDVNGSELTRENALVVVLGPGADEVLPVVQKYVLGRPLQYGGSTQNQILLYSTLSFAALQSTSDPVGQTVYDTIEIYREACADTEKQLRALQDCSFLIERTTVQCLFIQDYGLLGNNYLGVFTLFQSCVQCACSQTATNQCFSVPSGWPC